MTKDVKQLFLLDWCPFGTTRADLSQPIQNPRYDPGLISAFKDKIEGYTGHRPDNLIFTARADGLLIFSFDVPTVYHRYDVRDAAHWLSLELKTLLFEHRHHHHKRGNRGVGIHYPISFELAPWSRTTYQGVDAQTKNAMATDLDALICDDVRLYDLRPVSWGGLVDANARAILLLDRFIARRYDDCINAIHSNENQLKRGWKKKLAQLAASFTAAFGVSYVANAWALGGQSGLKQYVTFTLIAAIATLLVWFYMSYRNNYRYTLHMLNSYIGFFERAGDFSEVVNAVCGTDAKSRSSEAGYRNLIGSLCAIKEDVQRKINAEENVIKTGLSMLGLVLALVAIVDF